MKIFKFLLNFFSSKENRIDNLEAQIGGIGDTESAQKAIEERFAKIETSVQFLEKEIDNISIPDVTEIKTDIATIKADLESLDRDISKLESLGWKPTRTIYDSVSEYKEWLNSASSIDNIIEYCSKKMEELNVLRDVS